MILHQVVSLSLARSFKTNVKFEEPSELNPDLILSLKDSTEAYIDVTGPNVRKKLNKYKRINKLVMIINKYDLSFPFNIALSTLIEMSYLNDSRDTDFIMSVVDKQSEVLGETRFYGDSLLKFFVNGKDQMGRRLLDHSKSAKRALHRRISSRPTLIQSEMDHNEVLKRHLSEMNLELPDWRDKPENKAFIINYDFLLSAACEEEDESQNYNIRLVVEDSIVKILGSEDISDSQKDKLYERIDLVRVHQETYIESKNYGPRKHQNAKSNFNIVQEYLKKYKNADLAYYRLQADRVTRNSSIKWDEKFNDLSCRLKEFTSDRHMEPKKICPLPNYTSESHWTIKPIKIDPDHLRLLNECKGVSRLKYLLSHSREYNDLRFRHRVAVAISLAMKPDKPFRVNHWFMKDIKAEVLIKGMLFDSDKGIAIVTFLSGGLLVRTEKWRLSDVESYLVGHHRLLCSILSLNESCKLSTDQLKHILILYGRILNENSWGLSKFLKPFRYWSTGMTVRSPMVEDQFKKMINEVSESVKSKLSMHILFSKSLKEGPDSTPLLGLPPEYLGYEIFLVNLCPSKTYGKAKHLKDTLMDLKEEISLFKEHMSLSKEIYEDFELNVLRSENLDAAYESHIDRIERMSKVTGQRFTGGPLSVVLISEEILRGKRVIQPNTPPLEELLTAKASFNSFDAKAQMAMESIVATSKKYSSDSTSMIGLKILAKKGVVDLTMRMFDKDQVGGNREISILTGEFRILQSICENFCRSASKELDNEFLDRKDKIDELYSRGTRALTADYKLLSTKDQTRWGPNFNTAMFGLMLLTYTQRTTEAYIPSIICLMSEFKVFEVPPWIFNLLSDDLRGYTLLGEVGRSHMGQGIFHVTSSLFHAHTSNTIQQIYHSICLDEISLSSSNLLSICNTNMVTSDDLSEFSSINLPTEESLRRRTGVYSEKEIEKTILALRLDSQKYIDKLRKLQLSYCDDVIFFGIKTSSYKLIIAEWFVEFNSEFLMDKGIGSNELKFIYSLIDPHTTGSFLNDYKSVLDVYYSAINSGCSIPTSLLIAKTNYLSFCRQWKLDTAIVDMPSNDVIKSGLYPTKFTGDPDSESTKLLLTRTYSNLRFKTRKRINETIEDYHSDGLMKALMESKLSAMIGTRERTAYRSSVTHHKGPRTIMNFSDYYRSLESIGETYDSFVYHQNKNPDHYSEILNSKVEKPYYVHMLQRESRGGLFQRLLLRTCKTINFSTWQILLSLHPYQEAINNESTKDQIHLHLMRSKRTGEISDIASVKSRTLEKQLKEVEEIKSEMEYYSSNSVLRLFKADSSIIKYMRVEVSMPITELLINRTLVMKSVSFLPNQDLTYSSYPDYIATISISSDFNQISQSKSMGQVPCQHGSSKLIEVHMPDIEMISSLIDEAILVENDRFHESRKRPKVYMNVLVKTEHQELFNPKNEDLRMTDEQKTEMADKFMEMMGMDFLDDIESESENESESSFIGQSIAITSSGLSHEYITIEVDKSYLIYSYGYFRRKVIANSVLRTLINHNVCSLATRQSQVNFNNNLYFIGSRELSFYCYTPDFQNKFMRFIDDLSNEFQSKQCQYSARSISLAKHVSRGGEAFVGSLLEHPIPLIVGDKSVSFTTNPLGKLVSQDEMIRRIESLG
jgi:hypothetical protein